MERLFFIPAMKTPEISEIICLLDKHAFPHEPQVCSSTEDVKFVNRLEKLVDDGCTPVLLGWGCCLTDKGYVFSRFDVPVPKGVVVFSNTVKESWLKQVARMINVDLNVSQKLKGYFSTWSFAQLRVKGFSSDEIMALMLEQFQSEGGTEADLAVVRRDVDRLTRNKMLVCVNLEKRLSLFPARFYIEEDCFSEGVDMAALVTFRDGTLPVYLGKASVVKALAKKFSGTVSGDAFYLEAAAQRNAFVAKVKKMYR